MSASFGAWASQARRRCGRDWGRRFDGSGRAATGTPDPLLFSVIIPTCDRDDSLALCLERVAPGAQTLAADRYEVIVTDDGRDAATEAMMRGRFPWAQWTQGPRRGPAANRNHGASLAHGEWLVFLDDDCVPGLSLLAAYHAAAALEPQAQVLEGRITTDAPRPSLAVAAPSNESGGCLWSCNFAIRAGAFTSVGGFDETFPYPGCEDTYLRYRLLDHGYTFPFVPCASVWHPLVHRGGLGQVRRFLKSNAILADKVRTTPRRLSPGRIARYSLVGHMRCWLLEGPRIRWRGMATDLLWLGAELILAARVVRLSVLGHGDR